MLKFQSIDGQTYEAVTHEAIVKQMQANSYDGAELTMQGYMKRTAATSYDWAKVPVRSDTPRNFIDDLVAIKVLKPVA